MKKTLLLLMLVTASGIAFAQTNFSGTWVLGALEHIAGPQYGNALAKQMVVRQEADSLRVEMVSMGGDGKDVTSTVSYAMDGGVIRSRSAATKRKYERKVEWSADKRVLTLTTVFYLPENDQVVDLTRVETWTLADKRLTVHKKSLETRSETWEVKGVYGEAGAETGQKNEYE